MKFIALDLETTGLSTESDTIIEIAAIRFCIVQDGDRFIMKDPEEHSQLIHPGRLLEQEITMITGITHDMLIGKPTFESVRDAVREFIGDAIIVGHNVLFDIAMLASHGIDLSSNTVIDTFELSEIFSQDIESLNLGFLANRYWLIDPNEAEHRALTDTKVSIRLFLRYLGEIQQLSGKKKKIWDILAPRDESYTLRTLSKICHQTNEKRSDTEPLFSELLAHPVQSQSVVSLDITSISEDIPLPTRRLIEIHGESFEELNLLRDTLIHHPRINLLVPGYKTAIWMSELLFAWGIENMTAITPNKWCSVIYMQKLLVSTESYSRKKIILILKLAIWMTETQTGLIDELKFYGDERTMLALFRSRKDETSIWRETYEGRIKNIAVLITDSYGLQEASFDRSRYTVIKDITLFEDIIRRINSQEISFDSLYSSIESLTSSATSTEIRIHMSDMVSLIRGIYESIPDRPTGPLVSPPGAYWETYFMTQAMLWHGGHKWLIHATHTLDQAWKTWKEANGISFSREIVASIEYIETSIALLTQYHTFWDTNLNFTLNIANEKTKITFIPRSVKKQLSPILKGSLAYGVNVAFPQTEAFLMREYGYTSNECIKNHARVVSWTTVVPIEYHPGLINGGTVILTTSQKHARDLGQVLRKIHGKNVEVLIQWLSGGKWKMLSIFKSNTHRTILIGLIDTWRDEYDLWKSATSIVIAKLPFDPPTDPYFLARTVWMSNNFSEYSEPIVTIRLNVLMARILATGYSGRIVTTDSRLIDTQWGQRIQSELL